MSEDWCSASAPASVFGQKEQFATSISFFGIWKVPLLGFSVLGEGRLACLLVLNPQCEIKLSYTRMFSLTVFLHGRVAIRPRGGRKDGQWSTRGGVGWEQGMGAMKSLHWWIGVDFSGTSG